MPQSAPRFGLARCAIVVMGVAGSGKTTLGTVLADTLGLRFIDGDDLHPPDNIAKMAAGEPLSDADRWPWLDLVAASLTDEVAHADGVVIACSALRRVYRDRIRAAAPGVRFVFLDAAPDVMRARLAGRPDHFMPPSLVASQFSVLEPPSDEPDVLTLAAAAPPSESVAEVITFLGGSGGEGP